MINLTGRNIVCGSTYWCKVIRIIGFFCTTYCFEYCNPICFNSVLNVAVVILHRMVFTFALWYKNSTLQL
jgi:hypothetical protein